MKCILSITILFCFYFNAFSQEVVASNGETKTSGNYEVSWTLGELVIQTAAVGSHTLTQGFHQTKITLTSIPNLEKTDLEIKVYPNPTMDFVSISSKEVIEDARYMLFDLHGKLIKKNEIRKDQTRLDMNHLPNGYYFLKVLKKNKVVKNFKIVKQ